MNDDARQVALVTGANRGIGREVAKQLAERGYLVLLGAREKAKAEQAASEVTAESDGDVRPLVIDVADPVSIGSAAVAVTANPGRLDVLVNNAGILRDGMKPGTEPDFDAIQETLETNYFGAYRTTTALLPLLRASDHGRIVNVSSGMGGVNEMGGGSPGYRVSKAALNTVTRVLSNELADDGVLVNSACPGFVDTDMGGPMGASKPVDEGAGGIVWLATLPDDGPTGGFFRDGRAIDF